MPPVVGAIGTAWAAVTGFIGGLGAFGLGVLQLGASAALSLIGQRLAKRRQADIKRELSIPTSRPPKRWIYGRTKAPGTPIIRVQGRTLFMGLILNSRPSAGGNVVISFDARPAQIVAGDLYDFDGPGATMEPVDGSASFGGGANRPRAWLGLGDQTTAPAEIVTDSDGQIIATDALQGMTVLWLRIPAGPRNSFTDRWPNSPPVVEVEMDWSRVWDPRDPAQGPDDPDTWGYSNNQTLCLLDAILNNPIRKRPRRLVDMEALTAAADLADEDVPLYYASVEAGAWPSIPLTVKRYTVNGILVWSGGELMDQLRPLADAGGGDLVQVGGVLSYVAPVSRAPDYVISDILADGGFEFTRLRPGSELPTAVVASYIAPERGWEESDLPALPVDAGSSHVMEEGVFELDLPFVTEPTQAMRIQKIARNRLAAQKRLSCTLPPGAITLAPGAIAEWGIPELPACAGNWRVEAINPSLWLSDGGEGVAMRCPVTLAEEPAAIDAWDPETDEFELIFEEFTAPVTVRTPPSDLQLTTGPGVALAGIPRIRFAFEPADQALSVREYEWQWREFGGDFTTGGRIDADVRDGDAKVFGYLVPVQPGIEYTIRVRTVFDVGAVAESTTDWTTATTTAQGPDFDLTPPVNGSATGGAGEITAQWTTPNNANFQAIEFWGSDTDDVTAAALLSTLASAANTVRSFTEDGLGADVTRYYWARSRGPFGSVSAFTASVSATTDP